jgi:hypothetical protein
VACAGPPRCTWGLGRGEGRGAAISLHPTPCAGSGSCGPRLGQVGGGADVGLGAVGVVGAADGDVVGGGVSDGDSGGAVDGVTPVVPLGVLEDLALEVGDGEAGTGGAELPGAGRPGLPAPSTGGGRTSR